MKKKLSEVAPYAKWIILFAIWGAEIKPILRGPGFQLMADEVERSPPGVNSTVHHYDVILNSYMRGGSSMMGTILGFRDDSFYVYEPLWKTARWVYWHGNSTVCRAEKLDCRETPPEEGITDRQFLKNKKGNEGISNIKAIHFLQKFFQCELKDFENFVIDKNMAVKLGGPSWDQVRSCIREGPRSKDHEKMCLHKYAPKKCKTAKHRVAKVLRMTVDNFDELLRTRKNLKVVHLFRDPRAIVNSRLTTPWFPSQSDQVVLDNAETVCSKMIQDFKKGLVLMKKYPDRFRFLYYEDFTDQINDKVKMLYNYLNMSTDPKLYKVIKSLSVFQTNIRGSERQKNTAFWWRKSLEWKNVNKIDTICSEVYPLLGYKKFGTKKEMENLNISSIEIPEKYLLT